MGTAGVFAKEEPRDTYRSVATSLQNAVVHVPFASVLAHMAVEVSLACNGAVADIAEVLDGRETRQLVYMHGLRVIRTYSCFQNSIFEGSLLYARSQDALDGLRADGGHDERGIGKWKGV